RFAIIRFGATRTLRCPAIPQLNPFLYRTLAPQHRSNFSSSYIRFLQIQYRPMLPRLAASGKSIVLSNPISALPHPLHPVLPQPVASTVSFLFSDHTISP